jgi:formylglycine-generating enzyme
MTDAGLVKPLDETIDWQPEDSGMIRIPSSTFRMGSDRPYPEEAPVHCVTVDGFRIERASVTNHQFRDFVRATGHVTFAEKRPNPRDYAGALPHMLYKGSLGVAKGETTQGRFP